MFSGVLKLEFHDTNTDTDSDSPDTSIHPYVWYAWFPREDPRKEVHVGVRVRVRVRVGVVELKLN